MITAQEIINKLNLIPHPKEGGYFIETYRSYELINNECLPKRYSSARSFGTAIYYLLTPDTFSKIHKLKSDEVFHFYLGDPVEMINLHENLETERIILGNDILSEHKLQVIVKKNVWQGARLIDGGKFALLGTTVAPGFDFLDYEEGNRDYLISRYPDFEEFIIKLT